MKIWHKKSRKQTVWARAGSPRQWAGTEQQLARLVVSMYSHQVKISHGSWNYVHVFIPRIPAYALDICFTVIWNWESHSDMVWVKQDLLFRCLNHHKLLCLTKVYNWKKKAFSIRKNVQTCLVIYLIDNFFCDVWGDYLGWFFRGNFLTKFFVDFFINYFGNLKKILRRF